VYERDVLLRNYNSCKVCWCLWTGECFYIKVFLKLNNRRLITYRLLMDSISTGIAVKCKFAMALKRRFTISNNFCQMLPFSMVHIKRYHNFIRSSLEINEFYINIVL